MTLRYRLACSSTVDGTCLENVGSDSCLDAKASDVGNGGAIIQWACNGSDQYQMWNRPSPTQDGPGHAARSIACNALA